MGIYKLKLENDDEYLQLRLSTLLNVIKSNISLDWKWKILWIEAKSNSSSFNVLDFEKKINNSDSGVLFVFDEIIKLDQDCSEIIEILIIADTDISKLHRYQNDSEMYESCKLSIELVDSSYWVVYCRNQTLIQALSVLNG